MRWRLLLPLLVILLLLFPGVALAQDSTSYDDLLLRVNGPATVNANDVVGTVVVISDNAVISGVVKHDLIVLDGDATVTGTVEGTVTMYRGTLDLRGNSRVMGDVTLIDSDITQAASATLEGKVTHSSFEWSGWEFFAFSAYLWISFTILILAAGLIFAAVGGRQLTDAGNLITNRLGATVLTTVIVVIGVPILATVAAATVLGIPLGIGMIIFLAPALWFFGYLVAGTKLGAVMLRQKTSNHPYLAAVIGLVVLQAVGLIPFLGGFVSFVAGILGTGALVLLAWHAFRGPRQAEPVQTRFAEPAAGD